MIIGLCQAGMNVARLNFSHGVHAEHQKRIDVIKKVREDLDLPIAIMLDTKGPEYRIKTFENKKINLSEGDTFTFTTQDIVGNESRVSVSYDKLTEELSVGDKITLTGRLQSRAYQKQLADGTVIEKTAYEVSVGHLELITDDHASPDMLGGTITESFSAEHMTPQ